MSYRNSEVRPLVGKKQAVEEGPRRRTGPQHAPLESGLYVTSNEDFTKQVDRRNVCGKACSSVGAFCCARPPTDSSSSYYEDTFNDEPVECTFGTDEPDGIWVNYSDQVGTIMSSMVWILITYSMVTITLLAQHNRMPDHIAIIYDTICSLALACHVKTMFTDPGAIPKEAVPMAKLFRQGIMTHAMCSHCQTYKPPNSHHCRICNRCISRMDHHCPWMNNCVGAGNFKHFILFLGYTWTGCTFALLLFTSNYFFCRSEDCQFDSVLIWLVRVMTFLCLATLLFVSSMLMNVTYGIITGIGTIDRLKKKATGTVFESEEEPLELTDIFGCQGYWTWALPMDPIFPDYDKVMGYSIPQRLLREKQRDGKSAFGQV